MNKFLKAAGGVLLAGAIVFCVGATTYAVNPDFKYWVDTEIIMTVEKETPEDETQIEKLPEELEGEENMEG